MTDKSNPVPNAGTQPAFVDIVFDGPPAHESGRFVECENEHRASISLGELVDRDDGYSCLRIPDPRLVPDLLAALEGARDLLDAFRPDLALAVEREALNLDPGETFTARARDRYAAMRVAIAKARPRGGV